MPFLNALKSSPNRLNPVSNDNCASCSAAGAVSLIRYSHSSITSSAASKYAKKNLALGPSHKLGGSRDEACENIIHFVKKNTNRVCSLSESEMNLLAATHYMKKFPSGTVFVVIAVGPLIGNPTVHCHALNAFNNSGKIYYIDFQTNRDAQTKSSSFIGNEGPSTSDSPFVGVVTQKSAVTRADLHSPTQPGTFIKNSVRLSVMSFPPR